MSTIEPIIVQPDEGGVIRLVQFEGVDDRHVVLVRAEHLPRLLAQLVKAAGEAAGR